MTVSLDSMSICSGFHLSVLTHFICLNLVIAQGVRIKGLNFMTKKDHRALIQLLSFCMLRVLVCKLTKVIKEVINTWISLISVIKI